MGLIRGILPGQRWREGEELLRSLGVADIGGDRLREFGRGANPDPSQACGHCGDGRAAVLPDGSVTPCPLTRWMKAGTVHESGLAGTLDAVTDLASLLPARGMATARDCAPHCAPADDCKPAGQEPCDPNIRTADACNPTCVPDSYCNPLCSPGACKPRI